MYRIMLLQMTLLFSAALTLIHTHVLSNSKTVFIYILSVIHEVHNALLIDSRIINDVMNYFRSL